MSLQDRLKASQLRAFEKALEAQPAGTVTIGATEYVDKAFVVSSPVTEEADDALSLEPSAITVGILKADLPEQPAQKTRVTWEDDVYFIRRVEGLGDSFSLWIIRAERHRV